MMVKDYYNGETGKKVIDFCIGFFGVIILNALFNVVALPGLYFGNFFEGSENMMILFQIVFWIIRAIPIIASIGAAIYFFNKRRFISIGIIASVVIPLLLVGACFGIFFGFMALNGF